MDPDADYCVDDDSDGPSPSALSTGADDDPPRPGKRPAEDSAANRPFKRLRGRFNADYLELLNRDIDDAAHAACLDDQFDLPPTQLGLTTWLPLEKRQLFEALARLGRHDLSGIASRVGSKSVVEIRHYLGFLEEACGLRRSLRQHSLLESAEYPAAVELSQPCCRAQEEAADTIALYQEHREIRREEKKWGRHWNISPEIARSVDQSHDAHLAQSLPFAQLFHLPRWLRLSERFFMNSSIQGGNWTFVDDGPPSVWAAAFDDFHSLAVSITRRLVQTTLFISMSRIRAKKDVNSNTRDIVKKRDVEAAVASLGMPPNAQQFWVTSARRLRLNVYQELPDQEWDSDEEPMTYDQVESLLDGNCSKPAESASVVHEPVSEDDQDEGESGDSAEDRMSPESQEQRDISREAEELLWHSATALRDLRGARRVLERSIAVERRQEDEADRRDDYASYQAEVDMWEVLQKKPPMDMPKKQDPGPLERFSVDMESIYPLKRDWASQLQYRSEWEAWDRAADSDRARAGGRRVLEKDVGRT